MLFFPGAISSFFATILFFVVLIGGGYSAVRIYYLKIEVDILKKEAAQYVTLADTIDKKEAYYKKAIEVLQRNCNRVVKPAVTGGKLNMENLFNNEPR